METDLQIVQYARMRFDLARAADRERGEISATTIVWAAALVAAATAISAILVNKIRSKANGVTL
jgi:hypothetical protein